VDWRAPSCLIAVGFGVGLAPLAPGTVGSAAGAAVFAAWLWSAPPAVLAAAVLLGFGLGVWACGRAGTRLGVHDDGRIVWDEVIGTWLTLAAVHPAWGPPLGLDPAPAGWIPWAWLGAGFAVFRVLDVAKPWPIGWLDARVRGGLGVMLDDAVAGLLGGAAILAGRAATGT
jgi:phosphatidylglycerophosphatase A